MNARLTVWGDGSPLREFLHVDDLARAILIAMDRDDIGLFNVGSGTEVSIRELAQLVTHVAGGGIDLVWDGARPNGTPRKLLDSSRFTAATGGVRRSTCRESQPSTGGTLKERRPRSPFRCGQAPASAGVRSQRFGGGRDCRGTRVLRRFESSGC